MQPLLLNKYEFPDPQSQVIKVLISSRRNMFRLNQRAPIICQHVMSLFPSETTTMHATVYCTR